MLAAKTLEEYDEILIKIFKILSDNHVALSIDKCTFAQKQVDYLGYRVTSSGIKPLPRKLSALDEFPTPTSYTSAMP